MEPLELPDRDFFDPRNTPCVICGAESVDVVKFIDQRLVGGHRCAEHVDTPA